MDQITYNYGNPFSNQISSVEDPIGVVEITDIGHISNYEYDKIGNLTSDIDGSNEGISSIEWTVSGKV